MAVDNKSLEMAYYKGEVNSLDTSLSGDNNSSDIWSNMSQVGVGLVEVAAGQEVAFRRAVPLLKQSMAVVIALSVAYCIVFLLAVTNNSLVISVIYRNPQMRNVTNYFLANLAIADITVSFMVLPITLMSNVFTEWHYGAFLCKAIPYLQAVVVSASVSTQAVVAVERYFAIFYPARTIIRPKTAGIIVCFLWLLPMLIQVPWVLYQQQETLTTRTQIATICWPKFPTVALERGFFLGGMFLTCYLVPLCFIIICYSMIGLKVWRRNVSGIRGSKTERNIQKSKIRIVRMLIVVAAFFAISWLPLYSIRMRVLYAPLQGQEKKIMRVILPIAQWLGSANSCVNPFIYCYFSEQFRKGISAVLQSRSCCGKVTA